jgi:hypothetical protein
VALFSHKQCFGYGYEAVRIRVKCWHNVASMSLVDNNIPVLNNNAKARAKLAIV